MTNRTDNTITGRFDRWAAKPQTGSRSEQGRWVSFAMELRHAIDRLYAEDGEMTQQLNVQIAACNRVRDVHVKSMYKRAGYIFDPRRAPPESVGGRTVFRVQHPVAVQHHRCP